MQEITKNILGKLGNLREKMNEDVEYMILKYDLSNDKNHWSCICSAMDWIDVAKDNIDTDLISKDNKYMWRDVYCYLSAVDIIVEAITQIHRVVFKTNKTIFNDNTIFENNLKKNDYDYFKHIRAVFGAHPISIDEIGNKKYASWPTSGIFSGYDFAVLIYDSNKENEKSRIFGFKIDEVNKFLWKYVQYLDKIYMQIDKKQKEFINNMKNITIEKVDSILEQIDILMDENEKNVKIYKETLKEHISELYDASQNMQCIDLQLYKLLYPKYNSENGFGYAFGKLSSIVHSEDYEYPFEIIRKDLESKISREMVCEYSTYAELYVILLTSLYYENYQ